ncbi:hypothetical protein ACLOJK_019290, partial [Asimina triloba]
LCVSREAIVEAKSALYVGREVRARVDQIFCVDQETRVDAALCVGQETRLRADHPAFCVGQVDALNVGQLLSLAKAMIVEE